MSDLRYYLSVLLIVTLLFNACSNDGSELGPNVNQPVSALINGEEFVSNPESTIAFFQNDVDGHMLLFIEAYDIDQSDPVRKRVIKLMVVGPAITGLIAGTEFLGMDNSTFTGAIGDFEESFGSEQIHWGHSSVSENEIQVEITNIDTENNLISGTFEFIT